jgi:hypothetical protein
MRPLQFIALLALAAALYGVAGCTGGPAYGDVAGEVTLDGAPLREGVVRFVPVDGNTPTASALIENGEFRTPVPAGKHRVEISAPKLPKGINSSKEMKRGTVDEGAALEDLLPTQYNTQSTLTADVKKGANKVSYRLKSN